MSNLDLLYSVAEKEVGYNRWTDPEPGTKYGRFFAEKTGNAYYGQSGVPYCAMFVSYCAEMAGVNFPGLPSAYCPDIHKSQNVKTSDLQFMDLVLFDWEKDNEDDHIGFFVRWDIDGTALTIEGNTNNGSVCFRNRAKSTICGGVRSNSIATQMTNSNISFPLVRYGSKGGHVQTMQELLLARGFSLDKYGADGEMGSETLEALVEFQEVCNIEPDGECGPITWRRLLRV